MGFVANKDNWLKYADAVRDYNSVHRDDSVARGLGLDGVIAPGMWAGQHVCLGKQGIRGIKFKFRQPVYNGDRIKIRESSLYRGDQEVCSYKIFTEVSKGEDISFPESPDHVYHFSFNSDSKRNLSNSFGINEELPDIVHLASLAAPALLDWMKVIGGGGGRGIHFSQSVEFLGRPFDFSDIRVLIQKNRNRADVYDFDLYWISGCNIVARGKSLVQVAIG